MQEEMPTIEEIDEAREERGINKGDFSIVIGYNWASGWETAVKQGCASEEKLHNAQKVFAYYDDYGIIPLPGEV